MRDEYAWDRSGPPDPFVDEMESLLRHFDRRPAVSGKGANRKAVVAVGGPASRGRRRVGLELGLAAAAAVMLTLVVAKRLSREPPVTDSSSAYVQESQQSRAQATAQTKPAEAAGPTETSTTPPDPPGEPPQRVIAAPRPDHRPEPPGRAAAERDRAPGEGSAAAREKAASRRILEAMKKYWPRVEACVRAGREAYPDRKGYFWLSFSVAPDGSVMHVAVIPRNNTRAPDVTGCIVAAVETWAFAPDDDIPPGGAPVRIPIFLQEQSGGE